MVQTHLRDQPLEAEAIIRVRARLAEVIVDHQHPLGCPAERPRTLGQPILQPRRLLVDEHLLGRRLPHVDDRQPIAMPGPHLLRTLAE